MTIGFLYYIYNVIFFWGGRVAIVKTDSGFTNAATKSDIFLQQILIMSYLRLLYFCFV